MCCSFTRSAAEPTCDFVVVVVVVESLPKCLAARGNNGLHLQPSLFSILKWFNCSNYKSLSRVFSVLYFFLNFLSKIN